MDFGENTGESILNHSPVLVEEPAGENKMVTIEDEPVTITNETSVVDGDMTITLTKTAGSRMQWARTRRNMTQAELAKRIGKARATIVQYERDNILLSLQMCEEISAVLRVAPEYIAFGKQGLEGVVNAIEEVATLQEITYGRDGSYSSGNWAIPRSILNKLDVPHSKVAFYTVTRAAPRFNYVADMRLLINKSVSTFTSDYDVYLIEVGNNIEAVSFELDFTDDTKLKLLTGSGSSQEIDRDSVNMIGAVVGVFRLGS